MSRDRVSHRTRLGSGIAYKRDSRKFVDMQCSRGNEIENGVAVERGRGVREGFLDARRVARRMYKYEVYGVL